MANGSRYDALAFIFSLALRRDYHLWHLNICKHVHLLLVLVPLHGESLAAASLPVHEHRRIKPLNHALNQRAYIRLLKHRFLLRGCKDVIEPEGLVLLCPLIVDQYLFIVFLCSHLRLETAASSSSVILLLIC